MLEERIRHGQTAPVCSLVKTNVGHISCCLNMKTRNALGSILTANCDGPLLRGERAGLTFQGELWWTNILRNPNPPPEPHRQTDKMVSVAACCKHPGSTKRIPCFQSQFSTQIPDGS